MPNDKENEFFLNRVIHASAITQQVCLSWVSMARSGAPWSHTQDQIRKHISALFELVEQSKTLTERVEYDLVISELSSLANALPFYGEKVQYRRHAENNWREGICLKPRKLCILYEDDYFDDENTIAEWKPNILPVIIKLDPKTSTHESVSGWTH